MSKSQDIGVICEQIKRDYSPCDVSDALLKLGIPQAGHLPDIAPIPHVHGSGNRIVAPVSTVLFVSRDHTQSPDSGTPASNLPADKHWTDCPSAGTVAILQQPDNQIVALLGDIIATRLQARGVLGAVINGRSRDVVSCAELRGNTGFQIWSKALSSVGTSLEATPWAVDVPLQIGGVEVKPGDVLCADEGERVLCVIPRERLEDVVAVLPKLKEADDAVLEDARKGVDLKTSFARHREHYSNH